MPDVPVTDNADAPMAARIVEAARSCFRAKGVRRTRMGDIADAAGLARQTLYDWVRGRDHLVDLAMAERARELGEIIGRRPVREDLALEDQIVDVLVAMAELSGGDPEFTLLAQGMAEEHAFDFIAGRSELTEVLEGVLRPYFDEARARGVLRDELGTQALTQWVQAVLAALRPRRGHAPEITAAELRYFLIPALIASPSD